VPMVGGNNIGNTPNSKSNVAASDDEISDGSSIDNEKRKL
jgi:hypothetical protein